MRFGRIQVDGPDGPGARLIAAVDGGEHAVDLRTAYHHLLERRGATSTAAARVARAWFPGSLTQALEAGDDWLELTSSVLGEVDERALVDLATSTWLSPVDPPVLRDALTFEAHLEAGFARAGLEVPEQYYRAPVYYKGNPTTLYGHDAQVPWPFEASYLDYELEIAFVLWRGGVDLTPDEACRCIFGATIMNDVSARDVQSREMTSRLGPAKGKDFATVFGPWVTTADELDLGALRMTADVNGERWSEGTTGAMMWRPEEIVAYISQSEPLAVGEVVGSGTVGTGCGSDLGRRLSEGDVVELAIEGIGVLRTSIGPVTPRRWWPEPRERTG